MSAPQKPSVSLDFDPNFAMEDATSKKPETTKTSTSNGTQPQKTEASTSSSTSEDEARKAKLKAALANVQAWQPEGVPLTASGAYAPSQAQPSEPEVYEDDDMYQDDFDGMSDGDASRDLCSFPCLNCGAVPSFAMYELCGKCLDEMSPT